MGHDEIDAFADPVSGLGINEDSTSVSHEQNISIGNINATRPEDNEQGYNIAVNEESHSPNSSRASQNNEPATEGWSTNHSCASLENHANYHTETDCDKDQKWTLEDAFFAVIGGYAVPSSSFWPSSYSQTLTFTPIGLMELSRLGLFTKADSASVSDKSKADIVAKIIVCLQAGWFLIQCLARLTQGLHITLLEVHVLAHVLCTFLMYFLWFHKPYSVESPIILTDERVVDLAALYAVAGPQVCENSVC